MLTLARRSRGVTLIEVLITVTIVAILAMLGLPSFSEFMRNSSVRTAAETVLAGVQLARSEAVRRNARVEFALVAAAPTVDNVGATPVETGPHWIVRLFQTSGTYGPSDYIQGGDASSTPNVSIEADTASFNFTGLGRTNLPGPNTIRVTYPSGDACVADGGTVRCLNVVIQSGGQVRMCDPAITTAGDSRAC